MNGKKPGRKKTIYGRYFKRLWKGNEKRRRIANREFGKKLSKLLFGN